MSPQRCLLAALVALALAHAPATAFAEASCGSGGATGELNDSWAPSEYYLYVPSTASLDNPLPLFVALHGDEGDPARSINFWWPPLWRATQDFILLSPRAPYSGGSWYRDQDRHDTWLTELIEHICDSYNVDLDRVHLYGHSGGASFLGNYAIQHQDMAASVGCCIGGQQAWPYVEPPSPDCRIPARIVTGSEDFLRDSAQAMADDLEARGHEVEFIVQPGVGHDVTDECLGPMLDWLLDRPRCGRTTPGSCGGDGDVDGDVDGDIDGDVDGDVDGDSDGDSDGDVDGDADGDGDVDGGLGTSGAVGGCTCSAAGMGSSGELVFALGLLLAISSRRFIRSVR